MTPEQSMQRPTVLHQVVCFLVLTFALSSICYIPIISAGTLAVGDGLYVLLLMWCPGVAGLLTTALFQHNVRGIGWGSGQPRYLFAAYVLPLLYAGSVYLVVWFTGLGAFTTEHLRPGSSLLSFVLRAGTLGVALSLLSAVGEEIGWRGVLVPQLARMTSFTYSALLSGIIWTIWHLPLVLFADYTNGTPMWWSIPCFTALVVGISFAFAWLRLVSGSVWVATLLHASHNLFIQDVFDPLTRDTGRTAYVTSEFGLGLAIAGVLVGLIICIGDHMSLRLPGPSSGVAEPQKSDAEGDTHALSHHPCRAPRIPLDG